MADRRRIKIVSDGKALGTDVLDAETGESLNLGGYIRKITWSVDRENIAIAQIEFMVASAEIVGEIDQGLAKDLGPETLDGQFATSYKPEGRYIERPEERGMQIPLVTALDREV